MSTPLLVTRLYAPPPRPKAIPRRRLIARLDEGLHRKLTLVSAPAGFGKTTLVSEWIATLDRPAAWLSLDAADTDVTRFLEYLIAALRTVEPTIGEGIVDALHLPQPPPPEAILIALVNDLSSLANTVVLVLDDYHLVDSTAIDEAMAFLLDHLPPRLHLVITTREDPRLPLARLRARNQMTGLRASDLRFTPDETAAFLDEVMGLDLSPADVAALEMRTEGWIAGLQLAALSMQGRDDITGFIQAFAGDDRYIIDYLVEEVLRREPDHIRQFLLQTSILDRLGGPLCDAVTGRGDSTRILESLERANLFVVPLDDKRQWYRYHHLFADVLRSHAMQEYPADVPHWHRRASDWFGSNGAQTDTIRHAFAAGDIEQAARLVELAALPMLGSSQEATLFGWLRSIPDELMRSMPVLSVYDGFAMFSRLGLDAAEARFRDAERWLQPGTDIPPAGAIVADPAAYRSLPGTIAIARAYRAGGLGDVDGIVAHARMALELLPETDDLWNGAASAVLGIGLWTNGVLEPAYRSFSEGKARLERAGYTQFQVVSVHILADIRVAQGRLRDAEALYRRSLHEATQQGDPLWGTVDVHVGLSELMRARNDLDAAHGHLQEARAPGEHAGLLDTRHRWYVAMAAVREAEGALDETLALLDVAEPLRIPGADPDLRPIPALAARVLVKAGRLDDAMDRLQPLNLSVDDDPVYIREFGHMVLAQIMIARFRRERDADVISRAIALLERLLTAARAGERAGSVIELLVLLALAHEARGDMPAALDSLERALTLAEPEGYARVFIDEGEPMARLLAGATRRGIMPGYAGRLLAALGDHAPLPGRVPAQEQPLAEPLTDRELDVLRLIADGLSNQQIGDRLFLALSTVKGHNREIFGKLGVQRRTEAVARARELGLL